MQLDGFPMASEDQLSIAVHSIVRGDEKLRAIFGSKIYRKHVFHPVASGPYPRLTVACVEVEETPSLSRILRGEPTIGISVEFEEWHEELKADDSRSVASLLSYIRTLVDKAKPTRLAVPELGGVPLSSGKDWRWRTIRPIPDNVEGKPTAFFVGLELKLLYKTGNPGRQAQS